MIQIVRYRKEHQLGIDVMMSTISLEFKCNMLSQDCSQTPLIPDVYWTALVDDSVIATIGLLVKNDYAILKRMMLTKEFRGKDISLSNKLLEVALTYCSAANISDIYLGTMNQFKAAQKFYKKNGFHQILKNELPNGFMRNPLDRLFFKKSVPH